MDLKFEDRYVFYDQQSARLKRELEEHGSLYIAFDFDGTVFDYHKNGDTFPRVEAALVAVKKLGHKLILFTAREGRDLDEAIDHCEKAGYTPDWVNESPVMNTRKPYYNLLLDDRAGLRESLRLLKDIISWI